LASPTNKQPTTYRDRSQARGWLSIFHVTLLDELQLRLELRWCYIPIYANIISHTEQNRNQGIPDFGVRKTRFFSGTIVHDDDPSLAPCMGGGMRKRRNTSCPMEGHVFVHTPPRWKTLRISRTTRLDCHRFSPSKTPAASFFQQVADRSATWKATPLAAWKLSLDSQTQLLCSQHFQQPNTAYPICPTDIWNLWAIWATAWFFLCDH